MKTLDIKKLKSNLYDKYLHLEDAFGEKHQYDLDREEIIDFIKRENDEDLSIFFRSPVTSELWVITSSLEEKNWGNYKKVYVDNKESEDEFEEKFDSIFNQEIFEKIRKGIDKLETETKLLGYFKSENEFIELIKKAKDLVY